MRLIIVILSVFLALSIALNIYLYGVIKLDQFGIEHQQVSDKRTILNRQPHIPETINAPSPIEIAFNNFDFDTVLVLYEKILAETPDEASSLKIKWFELIFSAIRNAQDNQELHPYSEFIQSYLRVYPYDSEFLYLEVLDLDSQDNPTDLIVTLYTLLQGEVSEDLQQLIGGKIRDEFDKLVNQLSTIGAWDILATSLETLHAYSPNDRRILVNLAHAYAQSGQYNLMENILSYLPKNDKEIRRLREFRDGQIAKQEVKKTEDSGIPLDKIGDHYLVSAEIQDDYQALLMIDTGASTTVISRSLFRSIRRNVDTEYLGRFNINTANGQIRAPVFRFKSLTIGDFTVPDIAMVVLPLEELQADGLLGMNFLRAFRFIIDQDEHALHLFRRN